MALESVVLLKNADAFLPLKRDSIQSIAVIELPWPIPVALGLVRRHASRDYAGRSRSGMQSARTSEINCAADEIRNAPLCTRPRRPMWLW